MKIINRTIWNTAHLKAILQRAAEQELEPGKRAQLVVTIEYTRGGYSSGCAYVGGRHATVRVRHPESRSARRGRGPLDAEQHDELLHRIASVAVHEFAHIRGMQHAQMPAYYSWRGGWREYVKWVEGMPLDVQAPKVSAKPSADDKLAHVLKMKARAETRVKRATTILKRWRARERYYLKAAQRARQSAQ